MPRRVRHDRRRRVELTPSRALALTVGPNPSGDEPEDTLYVVWEEHRQAILADYPAGRRPWAWWQFEPGVPRPLRGAPPVLTPVGDAQRVRAARRNLAERRAAWLAETAA